MDITGNDYEACQLHQTNMITVPGPGEGGDAH